MTSLKNPLPGADLAVVGPTAVQGLGVAEGCARCARANPGTFARCVGFGPGCLGARERPEPPAGDASPAKR